MCVGTQPPRAPGSALLLLGLVLGAAAQPHCTGDTYPSGNRCCKECPPGYGMESRCNHNQDTVCSPCKPGYYNEAVNYEPCKPCTQCSQRSGSEPKQRCTPTRDTVCGCRPGSQPQDSYGYKRGVGEGGLGSYVEGACPSHAVTAPPRAPTPAPAECPFPSRLHQDGGGGLPGQGPRVACRWGGALGDPGE